MFRADFPVDRDERLYNRAPFNGKRGPSQRPGRSTPIVARLMRRRRAASVETASLRASHRRRGQNGSGTANDGPVGSDATASCQITVHTAARRMDWAVLDFE